MKTRNTGPLSDSFWFAGVLSVAVLLALAGYCESQNLGFMPGDAFFVVPLSEHLVASLPDRGGNVTLPHRGPPDDQLNMGGYAGFNFLRIEGVTPSMIEDIRRVYREERKYVPKIVTIYAKDDGSREEIEMNFLLAFVYNHDVDWQDQRIGLKYNEDWSDLPPSAFEGPDRDLSSDLGFNRAEIYQPLIETYDAVVEDWQNAKRFAPLHVQVPKNIAWGKAHKPIKEFVVARSKDVQIIIVSQEHLKECFLQKLDCEFYQITPDGVKVRTWTEGDEGMELAAKELDRIKPKKVQMPTQAKRQQARDVKKTTD